MRDRVQALSPPETPVVKWGSLGTSPPIKSEIAYSIPPSWRDTVSDLRLDRWAGTETRNGDGYKRD